jgi:hypothetical protein
MRLNVDGMCIEIRDCQVVTVGILRQNQHTCLPCSCARRFCRIVGRSLLAISLDSHSGYSMRFRSETTTYYILLDSQMLPWTVRSIPSCDSSTPSGIAIDERLLLILGMQLRLISASSSARYLSASTLTPSTDTINLHHSHLEAWLFLSSGLANTSSTLLATLLRCV